jgi:hypothetical protein
MENDFLKALIQTALWGAYKSTGNEDYHVAYDLWVNNYESIIISQAAAINGRKGGQVKSEARARASRENGRKRVSK